METRGAAENIEDQDNNAIELFILSHAEAIKANIDLDTLVPKLFNNNLLTPEEREELLYEREYPHVRKERLVTFLSKKGENVLTLFIKSLREANSHLPHAQLADTLEQALQYYLQQPSATNDDDSATILKQSSARRAQLDSSAMRERNFDRLSLESISAGIYNYDLEKQSAKVPKLDSSASVCWQFLNSCATAFEDYLNLTALHPYLLKHQLLTHHEEDLLINNASYTRVQKIQKLLIFIKLKGENAMLKFMKAIGQETTHIGHTELYGILMQNLSERVEYQELYKAMMDSQAVSKNGKVVYTSVDDIPVVKVTSAGASNTHQAFGQGVTHSQHTELAQNNNISEQGEFCKAMISNQVVSKGKNCIKLCHNGLHSKILYVLSVYIAITGMLNFNPSAGTTSNDPVILLTKNLRQRYMSPKWSTFNTCGRKSHPNLFVKLALIKKAKPNKKEMLTDKFFQKTLHGLIDDIHLKKESIEIENLFSGERGQIEKLLVDGAPGIGKTQLACHLCTLWAKGELLNQYELVIFVQLRRFQAKSADKELGLYDLITLYLSGEPRKSMVENLASSGCSNTLFILDGWDELAPSLREEFSFFHSIVSGDSGDFLNASVMITSRSTVSNSLRPYVDKHVEVLGFDSEQVEEYISLHMPQKKELILSHFKRFPNIQALSHIPLTLTIISSIVQDDDATLPSTLTPLYDKYVRKVLLLNLQKLRQYQELSNLPSFEELPTEVLSIIKSLAGLAWKGLAEDYLVFEKSDLEKVLDIEVLPDFDGYGLLMSISYDDGVGVSCLYQFCHLTVQEFLAAWHITKLGHDETQVLFNENRFDYNRCKYHVVWKFFSGLTNLCNKSAQEAIISKTRIKDNVDVMLLLHCVYEAGNPSVCATAAAHLCQELHVDNKQLNAVDCLCIAYMLASTGGKWTLNMRGCNMGTDGFDTLYSNLLRQQQLSNVTTTAPSLFSKLDLSHNYLHLDIDHSGIHKVADLITGPFVIKELWLDLNDFGDQKISVLAQAMRSNSTINSLSLANCGITHIVSESLADMLLCNKFLKGLL